MALNPYEFGHIIPWYAQFLDVNGQPLSNGHVEIFKNGTSERYISYQNFDGSENPFKIPLNAGGRCVAIGSVRLRYDVYVYNRFGGLEYSRLNVGINDSDATNLEFTSSDGSVIITRDANVVDFIVHQDPETYGTVEANDVDENGVIIFDTVSGGNISTSQGKIVIDAKKLYHITLQLQFDTDYVGRDYSECMIEDNTGDQHKFILDESKSRQFVELSWDIIPKNSWIELTSTLPENITMTSCTVYLHRVNPIVGGGSEGGGGLSEVAHDETLTGNGTIDSPLGVAETIKQEIGNKLSSVSVDGTTITGDGTPNNPLVAAVQPQVNADWNASSGVAQILNKPNLAAVATSGSYNDLTDTPTIPTVPVQDVEVNGSSVVDASGVAKVTVPTKTSDLNNDSGFITSSQVPEQVNSDWNASSGVAQILNKPNLAAVATSGSYNDLTDTPTIPTVPVDDVRVNGTSVVSNKIADVTVPTKTSDLTNDSGFITDSDIPAIPVKDVAVNGNSVVDAQGVANIDLSGYATDAELTQGLSTKQDTISDLDTIRSGAQAGATAVQDPNYVHTDNNFANADKIKLDGIEAGAEVNDVDDVRVNGTSVVSNKIADVTVPTKTSDLTNDSGFITASQVPEQVNSDWNASSGVAQILNKPNLAAVATSGDYQDLSNKPTINNVPIVTSNDDGKILKASYSGGVGSYSWETESGGTVTDVLVDGSSVVNEQGQAIIAMPTDLVPTVTSSDNGKILTATYSGGQASYAWADQQTYSQQQSDWTQSDSSAVDYIKNKPQNLTLQAGENITLTEYSGVLTIASKASGTVTDVTVDGVSVVSSGVAAITMPTDLVPAVTSSDDGKLLKASYNNNTGTYSWETVTIPAAQVNSDWNASTGVAQILNKPSIPVIGTVVL